MNALVWDGIIFTKGLEEGSCENSSAHAATALTEATEDSCLLFAMLVLGRLECLCSTILLHGLRDGTGFDIGLFHENLSLCQAHTESAKPCIS